ncbi:hypothetical protein V8C34DRAFT_314842 [Trichoderma compactum]
MSYDDTPDVMFNSQGDGFPEASGIFQDADVESRHHNLPSGSPSEADLPLKSDGKLTTDAPSFHSNDSADGRSRVVHLPQPANPPTAAAATVETSTSESPFLYQGWSEGEIAEELLTPETFYWWKARDAMAERGLLPDIPMIYPSGARQHQTAPSAAADRRTLRWEDLSLGVRWIILLRLSEQRPFSVVIIWQLDLSKHQVHDFVTSYVNFCDQWNAFEHSVADRVKAFGGHCEQQDMLLAEWIHDHRPLMPHDRITQDDVQMGLLFLSERGIINHNVDLQAWFDEKEPKDFARIQIDLPTLKDCMDYRLLRRVAVARLVNPDVIEDAIMQQGRDKRHNECNARRGGEGEPVSDDGELSPEAQAVLDTISRGPRIGEPMPMPIPRYQREQKSDEAYKALNRMVPELQPQYAPGGLAKTQWEIDNGYPNGYSWEYTPLHLAEDAADMESNPLPEELTTQNPSRLAAIRQGIAKRQAARAAGLSVETPVSSPGKQSPEQAQRYEQSPPTQSSAALLHHNVPRSRIGTAHERVITSNSKGQLMVGFAAVTGQVPQNPGVTGPFAELACCSQPEVLPGAVEEEPEQSLPGVTSAEDLEPDNANANVVLERSKRKRRPSARARESLQYDLEMGQCAETSSEKLQGKKARPSKPKRRQAAGEAKGSQDAKGAQDSQGGLEPTQEADAQEAAATGTATTGADTARPSLPVVVEEEEDQCHCVVREPSQLGSENSTTRDARQRPCRRQNCKIRKLENYFGMFRGEQINARPPPVSAAEWAWVADEAGFAVEAVQACYALSADWINTELLVPRQRQMDRDTARAIIVSGGVEYTRIENAHRSENGPIAERAEFAGVAETATFAMHAVEASFAFGEGWDVDETDDGSEEQQPPAPAL